MQDFEDLILEAKRNDQDLSQIVPKKPNWDLRRDVQPMLDKLKLETKKAIRKILQERVEKDDDGSSSGSDSDSDSDDGSSGSSSSSSSDEE